MIQANELRVGNLVLDNFDRSNPRNVTIITLNDFVAISNGCNDYHPIPLTEEWLLKCGFVKEFTGHQEDDVMRLQIKKNFLIDYDLNYMQLAINQEGDILDADHIKYVHQLQNLYFALTGEELNIEHTWIR